MKFCYLIYKLIYIVKYIIVGGKIFAAIFFTDIYNFVPFKFFSELKIALMFLSERKA
jgi:hypothetical protein